MFDDLNDLYQQVILDHCKKPRNFHALPAHTCSAQGNNPLCGDNYQVFARVEGEVIQEMSFTGSGCCISKASGSLLTEFARGRTRAELDQMFDAVRTMITTGKVADDVGKLAVFAGVYKYPARVKCAMLAWHAARAAVHGEGTQPVTTESEQI
jgi:nitrogen fixation NifU-like protein